MLYFADAKWWRWHKDRRDFAAFAGTKCSIQNTGAQIEDAAVHLLRNGGAEGFSDDPEALCTGQNSGYQAINLALLAGARALVLLGYDAKAAADGSSHWFGNHPEREGPAAFELYRRALRHAAPLLRERGVRVINVSPDTAVEAFEKMALEEALAISPEMG